MKVPVISSGLGKWIRELLLPCDFFSLLHLPEEGEFVQRRRTRLGGALSLLLVFRTNSAYQRFWEARRIWDGLLAPHQPLICETVNGYLSNHVLPDPAA